MGSKQAQVFPVTSFLISSSVYPRAIRVVTLAMGYPVALDASAEERLTRGFTSMTAYSKLSGSRANWQLQPPTIPRAEMISREAVRSIWYSLSDRVSAGATTRLSPV